jgi:hypothetical protein
MHTHAHTHSRRANTTNRDKDGKTTGTPSGESPLVKGGGGIRSSPTPPVTLAETTIRTSDEEVSKTSGSGQGE